MPIVFTRQEISSIVSPFFLHQGCCFCFLTFPFANIMGFCCQLLYLLPYHIAFQPTVFTETFFTFGNNNSEEAISHDLNQPPDDCALNSTSVLCRASPDTSLAAGSCTRGISVYVWCKHLLWDTIAFGTAKDEFLSSSPVKKVYAYLTKFLCLHIFKGVQIQPLNN